MDSPLLKQLVGLSAVFGVVGAGTLILYLPHAIIGFVRELKSDLEKEVNEGKYENLKTAWKHHWFEASRMNVGDIFKPYSEEFHKKYGEKMNDYMGMGGGFSQRMVNYEVNQKRGKLEKQLEMAKSTTKNIQLELDSLT